MNATFDQLYARADPAAAQALKIFRAQNPLKLISVAGVAWTYLAVGHGAETILFLHGMTGAYDIWWQQIEAFREQYRVIAVTYPAVNTLAKLSRGVLAILAREQVHQANVIGTSLGGYFTQYLIAQHPAIVQRAMLGNTFPPNDLIARKNRTIGMLLPFLPTALVMASLRKNVTEAIYPASGNSEFLLAFLLEQTNGAMTQAQFIARYRCVIDRFTAPDLAALKIPALIVEADNDPLVETTLREQLKATYPTARVHTLRNVGHFSYVHEPVTYNQLIAEFLAS